jgi:hypothetical protein
MASKTLERKDLIVGTIIAMIMASLFTWLGGLPLVVTFIPGLVISWLIFLRMYFKKSELPEGGSFFPIYFLTLAWQFIHFNEEFLTGFYDLFPQLYGRNPWNPGFFVSINMVAYFVFVIACLLVFTKNLNFLVIPILFFIVYGAIGNAIAHTWWVILQKSYFPGFFTAQAYWILGPLALSRLIGSRRDVIISSVLFALMLIPLLTIFIHTK